MNNSSALNFSKLLCGHTSSIENPIDEVLSHLAKNVNNIAEELVMLPSMNEERFSLYGTFLARSILELGATAFIARLDPFRILILKEKQTQPDYKVDKPHSSSIRWQGDVLSEKVNDLWADKSLKEAKRALLGDYFSYVFLVPVATQLLDKSTSDNVGEEWYRLIQSQDANELVARIKKNFESLYSSLSKGIHHEFVVPTSVSLDKSTVTELINDVLFYVSTLALLVGLVPYVYNKMNHEDMFSLYKDVKNLEMQ